jgi:hypothetical protein
VTVLIDLREPVVNAYIWWCGDEVCACYQPVIELYEPMAGHRVASVTRLWEGEWVGGPGHEDYRRMRSELEAECERRRIPKGETKVCDLSGADLGQALNQEENR